MNCLVQIFKPDNLIKLQGVLNGLTGLVLIFKPSLLIPELPGAIVPTMEKESTSVAFKAIGGLLLSQSHQDFVLGTHGNNLLISNLLPNRFIVCFVFGFLKYVYNVFPYRLVAFSTINLGLSAVSYLIVQNVDGSSGKRVRPD